MFGFSPIGVLHALLGLLAIGLGIFALLRDGMISSNERFGQYYLVVTILATMMTFGIFRDHHIGLLHVAAALVLLVLLVSAVIGKSFLLGATSVYFEVIGYSVSLLIAVMVGMTELATRLPLSQPLVGRADAPALLAVDLGLLLLFAACAVGQVRMLYHRGT